MHFASRIVSKNFLIYFEMKGAACSFAKSGMGNNRVRQGVCLGKRGWCRVLLFGFFLQVLAFCRKQMDPLKMMFLPGFRKVAGGIW